MNNTLIKRAAIRLAFFVGVFSLSLMGHHAYASGGIGDSLQTPQAQNVPVTTTLSRNWSGYAATGSAFTSVTGTWIVPDASSPLPVAADAAWVGIGGLASTDLIQAGTQAIVTNGTAKYEAWYETLPNASTPIPLVIHSGDSVTASINKIGPNQWFLFIANNTTGKNYSTVLNYVSSQSSAEWIQERPSDQNGYIPLDNFTPITFTNANTTANSKLKTLAEANAYALSLTTDNTIAAEPSAVSSDGTSFVVTRMDQSAASQIIPQASESHADIWRVIGDISQTRTVYVPGIGDITEVAQSFTLGDGSMKSYSPAITF